MLAKEQNTVRPFLVVVCALLPLSGVVFLSAAGFHRSGIGPEQSNDPVQGSMACPSAGGGAGSDAETSRAEWQAARAERQDTNGTSAAISPLSSASSFGGTYVEQPDGSRIYILELIWGIYPDGDIGFSHIRALHEDGTPIELQIPKGRFQSTTSSSRDLRGAYVRGDDPTVRFQVLDVQFAVAADGRLEVAHMEGMDPQGRMFVAGNLFGNHCCHLLAGIVCFPIDCKLGCGAPPLCPCPAGGECKPIMAVGCRGPCKNAGHPDCPTPGACNHSLSDCKCE